MIGSLITRVFVLMFGYVYPAYECYKSVEMNKPDIDQLRFWCQYWILVAGLTVCERVGDTFVGWVPMYGEAKLAFFIYLWFPKTKGTTYVYDSFFRPYVAKHEPEIDRNLIELKTRAGDMVIMYFQKAASYSQTRVFDILQYIASQSTPPKPPPKEITTVVQKPNLPDVQPSSTSVTSSSDEEDDSSEEEVGPTEDAKAGPTEDARAPPPTAPIPNEQKLIIESSKSLNSNEVQAAQSDSATEPPAPSLLVGTKKVTRARLRWTRKSSK